jgi:hypothetical protein
MIKVPHDGVRWMVFHAVVSYRCAASVTFEDALGWVLDALTLVKDQQCQLRKGYKGVLESLS